MGQDIGRVGIERVEGWGMSVGSTARIVRPRDLDQLRGALQDEQDACLRVVQAVASLHQLPRAPGLDAPGAGLGMTPRHGAGAGPTR